MKRFVRCSLPGTMKPTASMLAAALLILAGLTLTGLVTAVEPTAEESRLSHDIKYLASDDLQGRGVGTDGLNLAAEFVRQEFS